EADLPGTVGDLRVVTVLRARIDAPRDEPEVAAAHRGQQPGEQQGDDADPLDRAGRRVVPGPPGVDGAGREQEPGDQCEELVLGPHGTVRSPGLRAWFRMGRS